jgi:hypothetical protein
VTEPPWLRHGVIIDFIVNNGGAGIDLSVPTRGPTHRTFTFLLRVRSARVSLRSRRRVPSLAIYQTVADLTVGR